MLTKRGKHQGADIPMCGVPVERSDDYLHRLIAQGHRVAVCEQMEDPAAARARGNKSVVRRDVVRLVTPGTLTEDTLLDARSNNYLLAIARLRGSAGADRLGLAWIDISTSEFIVTECAVGELAATLSRINPNEIIVADALYNDSDIGSTLREWPAVTPLTPPWTACRRCRGWRQPRRLPRSPISTAPRSASVRRCRRRRARPSAPPWRSIRPPAPISN
jgi:DNA mismatch repair protein MutS